MTDILFSLLTGIVSAFAYSVIQLVWQKHNWQKTKKYFESKIHGQRYLSNYEILNTLQIDPTDGNDGPRSDEEIIEEILDMKINDKQFDRLYRAFRMAIENMERYRAQALAIPVFTPEDFHQVDKELGLLGDYAFAYGFCRPIDEHPEMKDKLKERLIAIYQYKKSGLPVL
jgi:hypothetical protein